MNTSTLRSFFTVLFLLIGSLAFGQKYRDNFTEYGTRNDALKYGYTFQATVVTATGGITGNSLRFGPLSNPSSPSIFQTGWLNLVNNSTIVFDHKVSNLTSGAVLTVSLVDINGVSYSIQGGTLTSATTTTNTALQLGSDRTGWYRIRFIYSGTGGSAYGYIDNISSNINQSSVTSRSTKLADVAITGDVDKTSYTVGDNVIYTFNVKNNGPDLAESAKIALNLPAGMQADNISYSGVTGTYIADTKTITLGNINNGATGIVTVTSKVVSAGTFNLGSAFSSYNFMTDHNGSNNADENLVTFNELVLPVEFAHFSGKRTDKGTELIWTTAYEANASHFEILASADGKNFETVGTIRATGNSHRMISYNFTVQAKSAQATYYQIKEVDLDGQVTMSPVIEVKTDARIVDINVYPNPTAELISIRLANENSEVNFQLLDTKGSLIDVKFVEVSNNFWQADLTSLPTGNYLLLSNMTKSIRIVKQ